MAQTEEGKVKAKVKDVFVEYEPELIHWWPVPGGYGKSTVDCHAVYRGRHFAIEVKKFGGTTTALQRKFLKDNAKAGGISIVIEGAENKAAPPRNLHTLIFYLDNVKNYTGAPTEVNW